MHVIGWQTPWPLRQTSGGESVVMRDRPSKPAARVLYLEDKPQEKYRVPHRIPPTAGCSNTSRPSKWPTWPSRLWRTSRTPDDRRSRPNAVQSERSSNCGSGHRRPVGS
jgi:hypothetical protein